MDAVSPCRFDPSVDPHMRTNKDSLVSSNAVPGGVAQAHVVALQRFWRGTKAAPGNLDWSLSQDTRFVRCRKVSRELMPSKLLMGYTVGKRLHAIGGCPHHREEGRRREPHPAQLQELEVEPEVREAPEDK